MNTAPHSSEDGKHDGLPDWWDCDLFCIRGYAGTGETRCGWRGRRSDARQEATSLKLLCPKCAGATLLRLPSNRENRSDV